MSDPLDLIRMKRDNNSPETKAREQEQEQIKGKIVNAILYQYNQNIIKNNLIRVIDNIQNRYIIN